MAREERGGGVDYTAMVLSAVPNRPQTRHQATARPSVARTRRVTTAAPVPLPGLDPPQQEGRERDAAGRYVSKTRGPRRSASRPHAGRDETIRVLESQLAAAQSAVQEQHLARASVEQEVRKLTNTVRRLRRAPEREVMELANQVTRGVEHAEKLATVIEEKDKQLMALRVQLERSRKEATVMNTRRHIADVKRKHGDIVEALEAGEAHCQRGSRDNERVLKLPRSFSQWSANNAAEAMGEFLEAAASRAADEAEGARLQRHVAAKLTARFQPAPASRAGPCYGPCCRRAVEAAVGEMGEHFSSPRLGSSIKAKCKNSEKQHQRLVRSLGQWYDPVRARYIPRTLSLFDIPYPQLASSRAVREWRNDMKDELGIRTEVLEGKIVSASVPMGMAVANRIWDLRWSGYHPDYEQHPPHVQVIVDSAGAYRGVKQTTGVVKVVRFDGEENNSLVGNTSVLLYEGDDAYEYLAEKGKLFFEELNKLAIDGVDLQDGTHVPLLVCEGGDNKVQNASGGMCGASATKVSITNSIYITC